MKHKNWEPKKIKPKGNVKMRDCLGPGCTKRFLTTPGVRLCKNCKLKNEGVANSEAYSVYITNGKGKNE